MRLRWSPEAAGDLERIVRRIQKDNPSAARNVANTIYEGLRRSKTFPIVAEAVESKEAANWCSHHCPTSPCIASNGKSLKFHASDHGAQDWP